MSRQTSDGLFLLRKDATTFITADMWCRVSQVTVRTPVGVNVDRFLFYKVEYWLSDPLADDFATPPTPFDIFGLDEWATRVGMGNYDATQLEVYAHRAFIQLLSEGSAPRVTLGIAWRRLSIAQSNKAMYCFYDRVEPAPVVMFRSIYHESIYQTTPTTQLEWVSDNAVAITIDHTVKRFSIPFDALLNAQWFESFKREVILPATYRTFVIAPLSAV